MGNDIQFYRALGEVHPQILWLPSRGLFDARR
jgi:hypothetical protein